MAQGAANGGGRPGWWTKAWPDGQDRDRRVLREPRAALAGVAGGLGDQDSGRAVVDQADPHRLEELTASPRSPFPLHHQTVMTRRGNEIAKTALLAASIAVIGTLYLVAILNAVPPHPDLAIHARGAT